MKQSIYWFEKSPPATLPALNENISADAVVVGGGMAGLSAAQWLVEEAGLDVVLLEGKFCGAGATGISSGLINPDTELDAHEYSRRFGDATGELLMRAAYAGVRKIRDNIERYEISCDLLQADALYVADGRLLVPEVKKEHEARRRLSFPSRYYERDQIPEVLGTDRYHAAIRYDGTFGMSGGEYARGLRDALVAQGLKVYENSPALQVGAHRVRTAGGTVSAQHVFVCVDRYAPQLGIEERDVYHQQNFIVVSEPLDEAVQKQLFPDGALLVHDTYALYHYFRLTPEGRLILGGGLSRKAYLPRRSDPAAGAQHLIRYIRQTFPVLDGVEFTHGWAGRLGLSKDLLPIAGRVPGAGTSDNGGLHVALCGGGMTWSLLAGMTAAQVALEGTALLAPFFAPRRAFTPLEPLSAPLPKPIAFELSHLHAKSLLTGTPEQVAKKQRQVRIASGALLGIGAGVVLAGGLRWVSRKLGLPR